MLNYRLKRLIVRFRTTFQNYLEAIMDVLNLHPIEPFTPKLAMATPNRSTETSEALDTIFPVPIKSFFGNDPKKITTLTKKSTGTPQLTISRTPLNPANATLKLPESSIVIIKSSPITEEPSSVKIQVTETVVEKPYATPVHPPKREIMVIEATPEPTVMAVVESPLINPEIDKIEEPKPSEAELPAPIVKKSTVPEKNESISVRLLAQSNMALAHSINHLIEEYFGS